MADEEEKEKIKLDGSYGVGTLAELTIITKTEDDREKSEVFTFPFGLIHMETLNAFNKMHLILGYKIVKVVAPSALRELGLS